MSKFTKLVFPLPDEPIIDTFYPGNISRDKFSIDSYYCLLIIYLNDIFSNFICPSKLIFYFNNKLIVYLFLYLLYFQVIYQIYLKGLFLIEHRLLKKLCPQIILLLSSCEQMDLFIQEQAQKLKEK